jgi:hypothetical protein
MPRHIARSVPVIQDEGVAQPQRQYLKFTGGTTVDNPGTERTVVTPSGGGGAALSYKGYRIYERNADAITGSSTFAHLGSLVDSGGPQSWIDDGASDLTNGRFVVAEDCLLTVSAHAYFNSSATRAQKDNFSLMADVFPGGVDNRNYNVWKPITIIKGDSTDAATQWGCYLNFTDYFFVGDNVGTIEFLWDMDATGATQSNVYLYTTIDRIL